MTNCRNLAESLNSGCVCQSLDRDALRTALEHEAPDFWDTVIAPRPHMFSDVTVFVGARDLARMAEVIAAIEQVTALPAYRQHIGIARSAFPEPRAQSVFFGYDFHMSADGPQLIEINTNAGGGLLNAILAHAQRSCCPAAEAGKIVLPGELARRDPAEMFIEMFRNEWRLERGDAPLSTIAIVDDDPAGQYLQPEFELFRRLFERHGLQALICDPRDLMLCHGGLWHEETRIDLVYNRLTDFDLTENVHAVLREAIMRGAVVVTPHPFAHALYADKRNLCVLTDADLLESWGIASETRALLLSAIPRTELVTPQRAEDFWARRKQLFFKPATGYASKAAYRGDKITKRVFDEVLQGTYVAQALAPPSLRKIEVGGKMTELKVDLRNFVYSGAVQLVSARLWQGQTANLRTPGGGFAPVLGVSAS
ncbi:MAG: hypothetical protein QMD17_13005 [Rhodocyclaceae bacterium]|jgi:hypothetical protein|nr:hypothetical protein [Rhodocyclaceae bacterium]